MTNSIRDKSKGIGRRYPIDRTMINMFLRKLEIVRREKRERNKQREELIRRIDSIKSKKLERELGRAEYHRQLGITEDFYSTRAVAHASFFVASVFGLFTILTLMETFLGKSTSNVSATFIILSLVYWGAFGFGLYSFMNFSYYSNLAQRAQWKTAEKVDHLIRRVEARERVVGKQRDFTNMKQSSIWFSENRRSVFLWAYLIGSLLVFISLILCHS